jgi:hypothetical protein
LAYSFQPHYGPVIYSAFDMNEYQKEFLVNKPRPARKADNLTAIFVPII